jgi:type IV secretory pathway VirD2 relaxase
MVHSDEDRFRPRPGAPRQRGGGGERFVSLVRRQAAKAGQVAGRSTRGSQFGRGRVAARLRSRTPTLRTRRVVIKSRFVMVKPGSDAIAAHLRYIERDGVTREGERGQAYGAQIGEADTRAFAERCQQDRHQFRFILSSEDAAEIGDLRAFTRTFMQRMEVDLQTRLDWVAVDHWDTDNPHTHIVLRGRADNGQDLVIAPEYMSHGMRETAAELATEWLGPRTEREIADTLQREVQQERFTTLDRSLLRMAVEADPIGVSNLRGDSPYQRALAARLQHLAGMGLAHQRDDGRYQLDEKMEATLRRLGERGDILRAMSRAMRGQARECVIEAGPQLRQPIIGRIADKGLANELYDKGYIMIDAADGRAHYLALPPGMVLADFPTDGIVEVRPIPESAADKNIERSARDGIYRPATHLAELEAWQAKKSPGKDQARLPSPKAIVRSHVMRLESLRRAEIVERMDDDTWKVPADLIKQGLKHDLKMRHGINVTVRSHLPLARQIDEPGATWLDRKLIDGGKELTGEGFGGEVREAMQARATYLEGEGLARRQGERVIVARGLLNTLREREVTAVAQRMAIQTGLVYQPLGEDGQASGVYRRSVMLASGRYAMLDDGLGFTLVPWRPVLAQRLGESMSVSIEGGRATWEFGRNRGLSR